MAASILFAGACVDCGLVDGHLDDCSQAPHRCEVRHLRFDGLSAFGSTFLASVTDDQVCRNSMVIRVAPALERKLLAARDPELALTIGAPHG